MKALSLLRSSHLLSKALFILVFFYIASITYGMDVQEQESENRLSPLMDQNRLPKELFDVIFDHLPVDALKTLNLVSPDLNKSVIAYQEAKVSSLIGQFNTLEPTLTHDQILTILSRTIEINQERNDYFLRQLLTRAKKDGFLFLQASSPLSYYLYHHPHLTSLHGLHLADNFNVTSVLYKSLFNSELLKQGDATLDFLAHLQAVWPFQHVFLPQENQAFGAKQFLEKNKETILEQLQSIKAEKPYISFMNHHAQEEMLKTSDAHIVVTLGQINAPQTMRHLAALIEANANHTVILIIDKNYIREGCFNLSRGDLSFTLKHLRVVDPSGCVKTLGTNFMSTNGNMLISSFDMSGLYSRP